MWTTVAALFSAIGLIHQSRVNLTDWEKPYGEYCLGDEVLNINSTADGCPDDFEACGGDEEGLCGYTFTTRWRFTTAYLMASATFAFLYMLQRYDLVEPVEPDAQSAEFAPRVGPGFRNKGEADAQTTNADETSADTDADHDANADPDVEANADPDVDVEADADDKASARVDAPEVNMQVS